MRVGYGVSAHLDVSWLTGDPPWLSLFQTWLSEAVSDGGPIEANAMVLGTVDEAGRPQTRTVLCKGVDARGVVFFTGYESDKGRALHTNPYASVTFPWITMERQVHFRGPVTKASAAETLAYWQSRPRGSQLSAYASAQSEPIDSRDALEARAAKIAEQFGGVDGSEPVPVPPAWGGFRISPEVVEFWQGRADRLHNRVRATLVDDHWQLGRLQP